MRAVPPTLHVRGASMAGRKILCPVAAASVCSACFALSLQAAWAATHLAPAVRCLNLRCAHRLPPRVSPRVPVCWEQSLRYCSRGHLHVLCQGPPACHCMHVPPPSRARLGPVPAPIDLARPAFVMMHPWVGGWVSAGYRGGTERNWRPTGHCLEQVHTRRKLPLSALLLPCPCASSACW